MQGWLYPSDMDYRQAQRTATAIDMSDRGVLREWRRKPVPRMAMAT